MTNKTEQATAKTAYNKVLETPVTYEFSWSAYDNHSEVVAAHDTLNDDEVVKVRNRERQAKARQAALTAALDAAGIEKPNLENDPQFRLAQMYKILIAAKKTHEEARALAASTLGLEWEDE